MIRKVTLRRFKRFTEETFEFPGHIVLAGPNNTGKTTVLQAIAAWELALNRWRELNRFRKYGRSQTYTRAPIARQAFSAVPLRRFDLLWYERNDKGPIEIEIHTNQWSLTMELIPDSTEQLYVRPKSHTDSAVVAYAVQEKTKLRTVYIPPMTGLSTNEPVFQRSYQELVLGQGKPGDIIRNLLIQAHQTDVWEKLKEDIRLLFGYELLPPIPGAFILAEYRSTDSGSQFDIASAGSGFQQILMLLTFLYTNPASVLLLDEPDAHLHVILQDAIYGKLRSVAAERNSQLIISTHSEIIINSVEPHELCMLLDRPKLLADKVERANLIKVLGLFTNTDIMLALAAKGIFYVEGHTDIDILREWARVLDHPIYQSLSANLFWKAKEHINGDLRDHFEILKLVNEPINGVELVDGDDHKGKQSTPFEPGKLQRLRWRRYETESYLVHPAAILRYIEKEAGEGDISLENRQEAQTFMQSQFPPGILENPLGEHIFLNNTKASVDILPAILTAAGLHGIEKRDFYGIAAVMRPEEIHPEVKEKLDAIQQVIGS